MEPGQLLKPENLKRIQHIPCEHAPSTATVIKGYVSPANFFHKGSIVQGRYDVVCPAKTAWELHKGLPQSRLYMIPDAGHSVKVK